MQVHQGGVGLDFDVPKHVFFRVQNDTQPEDLRHATKVRPV
jgi:hypothetical protein